MTVDALWMAFQEVLPWPALYNNIDYTHEYFHIQNLYLNEGRSQLVRICEGLLSMYTIMVLS